MMRARADEKNLSLVCSVPPGFPKYVRADAAKLRQVLLAVRRDGYAIVDQELELGLCSMAVPVQNSTGRVVAAINSGVNGQRVSVQDMQTRFLPYLRAAAQELCLLLG